MKNTNRIHELLKLVRRPGTNALIDEILILLPYETCNGVGAVRTPEMGGGDMPCPDCQKYPKHDLMSMPIEWIGQYHNACTDPCDMLQGPCACGAWHHLEEWIITRKKLTKDGWVDNACTG